MKRAKLRGLKRNAAVVLGNTGDTRDIPLLHKAMNDSEEIVKRHAEWAASRIAAREERS
jgi:epoxyqueuosine reductase